ncbi:MAG: UDP-N-acetylglucosamine 1-carboxyvinyltransferase [Candidatus Eremiobacteraeota bacterium]|nr:UDP-N-acetylglucosamine 1-carboxyvinyltransferase [Candidatus Eremiobacteraeota bacterium]
MLRNSRTTMNVLDRLETTLRVRGGHRLSGAVETHGAKNAALPIMAAALLAKSPVTLHRIPRITDVAVMWQLLEALGARLHAEGRGTVTIDPSNLSSYRAPYTLVRKLAASFDLTGPLLGVFGRAEVPLPGGCVLGTRATDLHEQAFRALGAEVSNAHGYLIAKAGPRGLHGADIAFRQPSVGATKNAVLAAAVSSGTTTLRNVAMEPEVVDLTNFLVAMGARIAGQGSDTIVIDGVRELHGVEYEIIPDRIVTGTLLLSGCATRGDVTVQRCAPNHLSAMMEKLGECGVAVSRGDDWIRVEADRITGGTDVLTAPYPGFPTDLQPPMLGFLCTAPGISTIEETIFNARFSYVNELARMGADVRVAIENNTALVKGGAALSGAPVEAPDIRAGAALIVAGLAAQGETEIIGLEYVDRGYERLEEMLSSLGGQVQRASGISPVSEPLGTFETTAYPKVV